MVLIGGEKDKLLNDGMISRLSDEVINSAGFFSIVESIELLKSAKLLLTNDSAPTHMGICADIKVLTIYCSTISNFGFYPYNKKSASISYNDLECKPCGIHGYEKCPINTFDCGMAVITPRYYYKSRGDVKWLRKNYLY